MFVCVCVCLNENVYVSVCVRTYVCKIYVYPGSLLIKKMFLSLSFAKEANRKHAMDTKRMRTLPQARNHQGTQLDYGRPGRARPSERATLGTLLHLVPRKSKWEDGSCRRIWLGFRHAWELGVRTSDQEKSTGCVDYEGHIHTDTRVSPGGSLSRSGRGILTFYHSTKL